MRIEPGGGILFAADRMPLNVPGMAHRFAARSRVLRR